MGLALRVEKNGVYADQPGRRNGLIHFPRKGKGPNIYQAPTQHRLQVQLLQCLCADEFISTM